MAGPCRSIGQGFVTAPAATERPWRASSPVTLPGRFAVSIVLDTLDPSVVVRPDPDGAALSGALDVTSAARLRAEITRLMRVPASTGDFVLNLHDVQTVDTVGLGLLVGMHRQALRLGRRLVLADVPPA